MAFMVQALHIGPLPSTCAGFIISAAVSYLLNYRITFASAASHSVALPRFLAVGTVGLVINALLVGLLTGPAAWHWVAAQLCASAIVLCWNFAANRIWTFH
jgi:putative flippase GtrA